MNLEKIKLKINEITTQIKINERDINKIEESLKKEYGITDIKDIESIIESTDVEINKLEKTRKELIDRISKKLKEYENNDR